MKKILTVRQLNNCITNKNWDLGNKILYDLCKKNFTHESAEKILAKTWLIGRSYAVALERRKNKIDINENFYTKTVVKKIKYSRLDKVLNNLKSKKFSFEELPSIIKAHHYLTQLSFKMTDLEKRSFSSKYLHFHLPNLFFIYDNRAEKALAKFAVSLPRSLRPLVNISKFDKKYATFVYKCYYLQQIILEQHGIRLTPRQLDNLLLEVANKKASSIMQEK